MRGLKKELWEDLVVVWQDFDSRDWVVTRVTNHQASEDPSAPKRVTGYELVVSRISSSNVIKAGSKPEALLKYAALGGRAGNVWSIAGSEPVLCRFLSVMQCSTAYRLVKEEF